MENNDYLPKTELELSDWMKDNCYNFNNYSINGNVIHEGYGIERFGNLFVWYYTERGVKDKLKYFQTESEIVAYAFNLIRQDKRANAHCIGFTTRMDERDELGDILAEMKIEFIQDKIPYFGLERPVYRTFVFGCDINNLKHLQDKYYKQDGQKD